MDAASEDSPEQSFSSSGTGEKMKKVYVAVGRGESSKAMVLWAMHKFSKEAALVLLHVYLQPKLIPISMCFFFPFFLPSGSQLPS